MGQIATALRGQSPRHGTPYQRACRAEAYGLKRVYEPDDGAPDLGPNYRAVIAHWVAFAELASLLSAVGLYTTAWPEDAKQTGEAFDLWPEQPYHENVGLYVIRRENALSEMEEQSPGGYFRRNDPEIFKRPIRKRDDLVLVNNELKRSKRPKSKRRITLKELEAEELWPHEMLSRAMKHRVRKRWRKGLGGYRPLVLRPTSKEIVRRDIQLARAYLHHHRPVVSVLSVLDALTRHGLTYQDARTALKPGRKEDQLRRRVRCALQAAREPNRTLNVSGRELPIVEPPAMPYRDLARFLRRDRKAIERLLNARKHWSSTQEP
jgi:hypothetical protein